MARLSTTHIKGIASEGVGGVHVMGQVAIRLPVCVRRGTGGRNDRTEDAALQLAAG